MTFANANPSKKLTALTSKERYMSFAARFEDLKVWFEASALVNEAIS